MFLLIWFGPMRFDPSYDLWMDPSARECGKIIVLENDTISRERLLNETLRAEKEYSINTVSEEYYVSRDGRNWVPGIKTVW